MYEIGAKNLDHSAHISSVLKNIYVLVWKL